MIKKSFVAIAVVSLIWTLLAPWAKADESQLHLLDQNALWRGGCSAQYTISGEADKLFGNQIRRAASLLSETTGINLSEVSSPDADLKIRMDSFNEFSDSIMGLYTDGNILLRDMRSLGYSKSPKIFRDLKFVLILHEMMHWLGLDHDPSSKVMSASIPAERFKGFDAGDLAGLNYIGSINGCLAA